MGTVQEAGPKWDRGVGRVGVLSTVLAPDGRARLVFGQRSGLVLVPVMAEESLEGKDVVGRKIGVGRSIGVYFVCWLEKPERQPQMKQRRMTKRASNRKVSTGWCEIAQR